MDGVVLDVADHLHAPIEPRRAETLLRRLCRGRQDRTIVGAQTAGRPLVVIWLSTSCGACVDSVDFYRRLTSMPRRPNVAVLSPRPVKDVQQFLQGHAIRPDLVTSTNGNWMKFRGTPTILLLHAESTVKQIWFGRLQDAGDELNLLFTLAR